jgi:hypothetical protein
MFCKPSSSHRAVARLPAAALLVVAIGAIAGCSGNHLNGVPPLPAQPAQATLPSRSAAGHYRAGTHGLQVVRGHIRPEMLREPLVGTLPLRQEVHLAIGLPLRERAASRALLDGVSNPRSNSYRRYLTPAEFQSKFSPSSSDYQSVVTFARGAGFTIARTYPGRVVIDVEGSVATVQRAFHLTMQTRRRPDGSIFYSERSAKRAHCPCHPERSAKRAVEGPRARSNQPLEMAPLWEKKRGSATLGGSSCPESGITSRKKSIGKSSILRKAKNRADTRQKRPKRSATRR